MASGTRKILGRVFVASVVLGWIAFSALFWARVIAGPSQPTQAPARALSESEVRQALERACAPGAPRAEAVPALRAEPSYPDQLARNRVSGWVEIGFTIGTDGTVGDLELRRSDPAGAFDEVAMAAVAQWRYWPLGEPKESAVRLVFEPDAPTAEASPCANLEGPFATRLCRWLESTR